MAGSGSLARFKGSCERSGFLTVYNTGIRRQDVLPLLDLYKAFFIGPDAEKQAVNMALTGANRGWRAPGQSKSALTPTQILKKYLIAG